MFNTFHSLIDRSFIFNDIPKLKENICKIFKGMKKRNLTWTHFLNLLMTTKETKMYKIKKKITRFF